MTTIDRALAPSVSSRALPAVQTPPAPAQPTVSKAATVAEVIPSPTERLRLAVSGAVDRINLGLLSGLKNESKNPVLMGALTAVQLAQLMPTLTAEQQKTALTKLGLPTLTAEQYQQGVKAYLAKLTADLPKDVKLSQQTIAYVNKGEELNPKLQSDSAKTLDFGKPKAAADAINADIAKATGDMIKDLVSTADVTGASVVLAAAAFVEAPWGGGIHFKQTDTRERPFRVDGAATPSTAKMMHSAEAPQRLLKGDGFEALYLPNGSAGELGTVYIKPKDGQSVADFVSKKGEKGLREILDAVAKVTPTTGSVAIPKSNFEFSPSSSSFLSTLRTLGVPSSAQVLKNATLDLSGAVYKAKAETSEDGIKMAAAQAMIFTRSIRQGPPPPIFNGDRSMLQVVMKGDQIVFMNAVVDPKAGKTES